MRSLTTSHLKNNDSSRKILVSRQLKSLDGIKEDEHENEDDSYSEGVEEEEEDETNEEVKSESVRNSKQSNVSNNIHLKVTHPKSKSNKSTGTIRLSKKSLKLRDSHKNGNDIQNPNNIEFADTSDRINDNVFEPKIRI
mmetsp:Transcript_38426/g.44041  ORF Transcript_38426/g.44041 Transcript_38426/m.44041 type:complete len:139 (+) Transcript_38426:312-728(+)